MKNYFFESFHFSTLISSTSFMSPWIIQDERRDFFKCHNNVDLSNFQALNFFFQIYIGQYICSFFFEFISQSKMPCIHIIISECVWRRTVCESAFGAHYTRAVKSPLWSSSSKYEPPSQMINHAYTCMWYVVGVHLYIHFYCRCISILMKILQFLDTFQILAFSLGIS